MRNLLHLFIIVATCCIFSSCSSVMVTQDYDNSAPFSTYSTFALSEKDQNRKTDSRYDNDLINSRFESLITQRLVEKGFSPEGISVQTDLLISFDYSIRPKIDIYNISKQVGFSYGSYHRYGGVGARTCTDISEFDQGLLFIDIRDGKTGKLVWRGTGTDIVSIHATPEKINEQVNQMVTAILDEFPPR